MPESIRLITLLLPVIACASVDLSSPPECESLDVRPSLPDAACVEDEETIAYRELVRNAIASDVDSVYFSVSLDAASRLSGICIAPSQTSSLWSERKVLAARSAALADLPGGPVCLAERRLDFNRKSSIDGEIKRKRNECDASGPVDGKIYVGFGQGRSSLTALPDSACSQLSDDWIVLPPRRLEQAKIFVKPEVANPRSEAAAITRKVCFKYTKVQNRVACIRQHGWELLE